MKKIITFFILGLLISGCTFSNKNYKAKPVITVTIAPLRYFTEQIVGDKYDVVTMVPDGNSPETYEPTAHQMIALSESFLYIKVGNFGFERILMKKLSENAPHLIVVDSSEGIIPEKSMNGTIDPHTWTSPTNARIIIRNIYHSIANIDTKDSSYFYHRMLKLDNKILYVDSIIRKNLSKNGNKVFMIYHPALTYFAKDYKLTQIPIEEEGKEPSAAQLQSLISNAKAKGVKTLFIQKEFNTRNASVIADNIGAKEFTINPLNYEWDKEMIYISRLLK